MSNYNKLVTLSGKALDATKSNVEQKKHARNFRIQLEIARRSHSIYDLDAFMLRTTENQMRKAFKEEMTDTFSYDEKTLIDSEIINIHKERSQNTLSAGEQALGVAAVALAAAGLALASGGSLVLALGLAAALVTAIAAIKAGTMLMEKLKSPSPEQAEAADRPPFLYSSNDAGDDSSDEDDEYKQGPGGVPAPPESQAEALTQVGIHSSGKGTKNPSISDEKHQALVNSLN